ncbi:MAG: hypothetical protein KGL25_04230 [Gammaproteobacteria bacterium]|nr:hypothetical protein [Gammaproteobacteria bacterium]
MRRIQTVFATLSLATFAVIAGTANGAEPAGPPAAANAATPVGDGTKITKSRSNIQNNRQAAPPTKAADAAAGTEKSVVKTKTKSNQSND